MIACLQHSSSSDGPHPRGFAGDAPRSSPAPSVRSAKRWRVPRWVGLGLLVGLVLLAGACIPKPPPTTAPPYDDGPVSPTVSGSEVFVGSGLQVPTANAYGRSLARIAGAEVRSADAALATVPAGGGSGDPGDVGNGAALVPGTRSGAPLVVFDRCANGDCGLRSSLVFDDPEVSVQAGVSTTYSGTATLTVAGDGGVVRGGSSVTVLGTVVVKAATGAATLSLATAGPWADAAGVAGVTLDDVVVSGALSGLGGTGDVIVDGTGTVTGANAWGLAFGVAARTTATVGTGRPVVAVRGFDAVEAGAVDRLVGETSPAPEAVRRWLRAPEFWVISAPDGGGSPLGPLTPGTQVRLVYQPGNPALTLVGSTWTFGADLFEASMALAPAAMTGDEFSANATVHVSAGTAGRSSWRVDGPVRMNLSARQPAVVGTLTAGVNYNSGCGPCTNVNVEMPTVKVGPITTQGFMSWVGPGGGGQAAELEVEAASISAGRFGPIAVTGGSLNGGNWGFYLDVSGAIAGHVASASSSIILASATAEIDVDLTVDEQMQLWGGIEADLALLDWVQTFPATFVLSGTDHQADVTTRLSPTVFDIDIGITDAVEVTGDITLQAPDLSVAGSTVSVSGDAEWRRTTPGMVTRLDGTLDGRAADIGFDLASDAVFEWAGGQVALRDMRIGGALGTGGSIDVAGTLELANNVLSFEGTMEPDPAGWRLDLSDAAGAVSPFTVALTWDVDAGTLTGSGSLGTTSYGRVEVTDSGFDLFADADTVEMTPSTSGGRVLVDGGATLDAEVSGAVGWDSSTGMLHVDVTGVGSLFGRDGLTLAGTVDAYIVDGRTEWVDLDVTSVGEVAVGDRAEVRMDNLAAQGRIEGDTSTLATSADVDVLGAAPLQVAGDTTLWYTPEYQIASMDMALPVVAAGRSGNVTLNLGGNLASPLVFCTSQVQIDELGYGDFSLAGVTLAVCYEPPDTISVSGTVDSIRYRDQLDLDAVATVSYDLSSRRLTLSATGSGNVGATQVTDAAVDMVWDIPAATLTGTAGVDSLEYGRVRVVGGQVNFTGDADSFDVVAGTPPRVLVDGGATLDAEVSGALSWDEPTGMLSVAVSGTGTVLGRGSVQVSGAVDAHIVDAQADWIDLAVSVSGDIPVGDRQEIDIDSFTLNGRLDDLDATLTMAAGLNVLGVALPEVTGSASIGFSPEYRIEALELSLGVSAPEVSASLQASFDGDLATSTVTGTMTVDELDYGDLSLEGVSLMIAYDPPATIAVSGSVDAVRYRDQIDVSGAVEVAYDAAVQQVSMSMVATGRLGSAQITGAAVDMVWDIPTATLTGTSGVASLEYGRVSVVGGQVSFTGDAGGFDLVTSTAPRVLVDGGATLDAAVSGAVSFDEATGMVHIEVAGQGSVLGRGDLAVSGSIDAHIVDNQAEWIDLGVAASGVFPVGGRNEVRLTEFSLDGRLEGLDATLDMDATVDVPGVIGLDVEGSLAVTFTPGFASVDRLTLDLSATAGAGIVVGIHFEFNGNLDTFDLNGWITIDHLEWGDIRIDDLRVDIFWDGTEVTARAEVGRLRYQDTVDVGGFANLGWDPASRTISISGELAGRVGIVRLLTVQFDMALDIPARQLHLDAKASGRAVFGEGRHSAWFEDFHVWGDLSLDANYHASAALGVNGRLGFASVELDAPIKVWIDGTLDATFDGTNLAMTLSVSIAESISAGNVTLTFAADVTRTPMQPRITLHAEDVNFILADSFEFYATDIDIVFDYDGQGMPYLTLAVANGRVEVHAADWHVAVNAEFASLSLRYEDNTHIRADFAALTNVVVTAPGMESMPIRIDFAGAGNVVADTETHDVSFDLRADTGASVAFGGDAGVRFDDLHLVGTMDGSGLTIGFDATEVLIGPADEPWVVVASPRGTVSSDPSWQRWNLSLDVGTVTAGDLLLTGQVRGSLQIGETTTGGLTFDGEATVGGVIRTGSISAAGMWTGSSLTIAGELRTAGHTFSGQATWARLGGGAHRLASLARWEADNGTVGLDIDLTYDGVQNLNGTMTAYGITVWQGAVATGNVTATFIGTSVTAEVSIDIGPVTGIHMVASLDWDVDELIVASSSSTITAVTSVFGRPVGGSVTVSGSVVSGADWSTVDLTLDGNFGLLKTAGQLYVDDLHLNFTANDTQVTNGTFGGVLYLGPSNWAGIGGTFEPDGANRWTMSATTSSGNATMGSIGGTLTIEEGAAVGTLTANGVSFGPARLDNVELSVFPTALKVTSADLNFSQTSSSPPASIAARNVNIAWDDTTLYATGTLSFGLGGPGWLPLACAGEVTARTQLRRVGTSTLSTTDNTFGQCVFGEYGSGFKGIRVQLGDLDGRYSTDASGAVTSASLGLSGDLLLGDLTRAAPAHFRAAMVYNDSTQAITIVFAGSYGTYTLDGTVQLASGNLGTYELTLSNSSGQFTLGSASGYGAARVQTPIQLTGQGADFTLYVPSITLEAARSAKLRLSATATDVTLTKSGDHLVLTESSGGAPAVVANFGAAVVTAPTVRTMSAEVRPGSLNFSIDADFSATINDPFGNAPPATFAFSTDLEVTVDPNAALISVGADLQASLEWQPVFAPDISGNARIAGTVDIDLDSLVVAVTDGEIAASPVVTTDAGPRPLLVALNSVTGTVDLAKGGLTFGGGLAVLADMNWTMADTTLFDGWGYVTGNVTVTQDGVQFTNGTIDFGANGLAGVLVGGVLNAAGPEVTDAWGRYSRGMTLATMPWCGRTYDLLWTGPACTTKGTVTGHVEADLDLDGVGDGWPADPAQRPAGVKVGPVADPSIGQFVNPEDGSYTLVGVALGPQTIQVTAPATWSVVGTPTRTVTVAANTSVEATPPFVVNPYDGAGSAPSFVGAVDGKLDLGEVVENVGWRNRKQTDFPIQVVDPDGDSVMLTMGGVLTPSFTCSGGLQCLRLNEQGVIEFNPPVDWDGVVEFPLTADDGHWEPVTVQAKITVKPLDCGGVSVPSSISLEMDEDSTSGGRFVFDDGDCDVFFPNAKIVTQAEHGLAGTSIEFIDGQPTHNVVLSYMPQPDWSGVDSFVVESCTSRYELEYGPHECAQTTVYVTVRPVDDPPRLAARVMNPVTGQFTHVQIEYWNKVAFPFPPVATGPRTFQLWAYDPEGLYNVEDGTIAMTKPDATSERTPEDLGLSRSDFAGYGNWDLTITPPPGDWDSRGEFEIELCDIEQCNTITAYIRPQNPEGSSLARSEYVSGPIQVQEDGVSTYRDAFLRYYTPSILDGIDVNTATIEVPPQTSWGIGEIEVTSDTVKVHPKEGGFCDYDGSVNTEGGNPEDIDAPYMPTAKFIINGIPVWIQLQFNCPGDDIPWDSADPYAGYTQVPAGETRTHAFVREGGNTNVYNPDPRGEANPGMSDADVLRDDLLVGSVRVAPCGQGQPVYEPIDMGEDQVVTMPGAACFTGLNWVHTVDRPTNPQEACMTWIPNFSRCDHRGGIQLPPGSVDNVPVVGPDWRARKIRPGEQMILSRQEVVRDMFGAIDPEQVFDLDIVIEGTAGLPGQVASGPGGGFVFNAPTESGTSRVQLSFEDSAGQKTKTVDLVFVVDPSVP